MAKKLSDHDKIIKAWKKDKAKMVDWCREQMMRAVLELSGSSITTQRVNAIKELLQNMALLMEEGTVEETDRSRVGASTAAPRGGTGSGRVVWQGEQSDGVAKKRGHKLEPTPVELPDSERPE